MIRPPTAAEVAKLPALELEAASRFRTVGLSEIADRPPMEDTVYEPFFQEGGLLVATDESNQAVGFIVVGTVDGDGYVDEVSVLPDHGGKGLGRALMQGALDIARRRGHSLIRLTTFRDVPWNAPWYRRLGFRELDRDAAGAELQAILKRQDDLQRLSPRIAMERPLRD